LHKKASLTVAGIFLNGFLFLIKFVVGIFSGSLALMSDALNSLTDLFASFFIHVAVRVAQKKPDERHPFGYHRAEPLAAILVAIYAAVLGFEVLQDAITSFFQQHTVRYPGIAIGVLLITIVTKSVMAYLFLKQSKESPALKATGIDSRNDVLVSSVALFGILCSIYGVPLADKIAAIIISGFIFHFAYRLSMENVDYLMGRAPPGRILDKIHNKALGVEGVIGINDVFAHYVGQYIHIEMDKKLSLDKAHDIGKEVQHILEDIKEVDRAFIHIDPR
jgi:cation diffusion facilitator family transporter